MFKQKSDSPAAALSPADAVQQARTRARQRLIGAIVLLAIGIIGFPLVFETQPRPIPVDIPIEIPRKDGAPPLLAPPAPPAPSASGRVERAPPPVAPAKEEVLTESRGDAGREVAAPRAASSAASAATTTTAATTAATASGGRAASSVVARAVEPAASLARPPEPRAEAERARALLEDRPVAAASGSQRFVVQVGAFADAEAARETRLKVEKLGMKTYTQVAQTTGGNRIRVRVGPFASRAEADAALAKAKAAGLAAVVLTL